MATSPNYGWAEPDNSSLVKNGAQDIRALGDAIDSSLWAVGYGQAGKNRVINGDFGIWQRGTSFTLSTGVDTYCADRFLFAAYGSGTAATASRQTFTPGTAPVAGYEGQFFGRITNFGTASAWQFRQRIEDVRTHAGQTVTFSFWAKAGTALSNLNAEAVQNFGSGGSATVTTSITTTGAITTSWVRYSFTVSIPSISGKTVGTSSYLEFNIFQSGSVTSANAIDTWGWQVEYGSKATPFDTASGTLGGELALCQRYYHRFSGEGQATATLINSGIGFTTTVAMFIFHLGTTMRIGPSSMEVSNQGIYNVATALSYSGGTWSLNQSFDNSVRVIYTHGSPVLTVGSAIIPSSTTTSNYFAFSAEL